MGKRKYILSFLIILSVLIILSGTGLANKTGDYSISKYSSYITIDSDGSVYFEEYITYKIHKDNAVIKKPVLMTNTSGMEGLEVYIEDQESGDDENNEAPMTKLEQAQVKPEGSGDNVFFVDDKDPDTNIIEIQASTKDKSTVTYCYRYTLKDQISVYNDTAVFFWQFIMPNNGIDIKDIEILISSPNAVDTLDLMGFITGTIHGEKANLEGGSLHIGVKDLKADEYLEVTVLMPTELVPDGRKVIDNYVRESIIAELELWESNAQKLRQLEHRNKVIGYILCGIGAVVIISIVLLIFLKKSIDKKGASKANTGVTQGSKGTLKGDKGSARGKGTFPNYAKDLYTKLAALFRAIGENICAICNNIYQKGKELFCRIIKSSVRSKEDTLFGEGTDEELIVNKKLDELIPQEEVEELTTLKGLEELVVERNVEREDYLLYSLTPAELCVLTRGKQNRDSLLATVLYLVRQKFLEIGYDEKLKGTIYLREDIDRTTLKPYEAYIISWLFKDVGDGNSLPLTELDVLINFIKMGKMDYKLNTFTSLIRKNTSEYDSKKIKKDASVLKQYLLNLSASPQSVSLDKWEEYILYAIPLKIAGNILDEIIFQYPEKSFDDGNLTILSRNNLPWLLEKVRDNKSKPLFTKKTFTISQ